MKGEVPFCLLVLVLVATQPAAKAQTRNTQPLTVVATETTSFAAARKLESVEAKIKQPLIIVASKTCSNLKPGLFLVALKNGSKAALAAVKTRVPDAYHRACNAPPNSLHALGISAIDPSFSAVSASPINWSSADSVAHLIGTQGRLPAVLVRPYFSPWNNDPLEGLQNAIDLLTDTSPPKRLIDNCMEPVADQKGDFVAIGCATERVAEQSIFETRVYRLSDAALIKTQARCAKPTIDMNGFKLTCQIQSISKDGAVNATTKTLDVR